MASEQHDPERPPRLISAEDPRRTPAEQGEPAGPAPTPEVRAAPGLDWRRLHLWQIQPLRDAMVITGLIGTLYLGYVLRVVTVPLLLAMLLAYLVEPLVAWVTRRGWFSRPGVAMAFIAAVGLLGIVPATIGLTVGTIQAAGALGQLATNTGKVLRAVDAAPAAQPMSDASAGDAPPEGDAQPGQEPPPAGDAAGSDPAAMAAALRLRDELPAGFWRSVADQLIALKAEPDRFWARLPAGGVDAIKRSLLWINDNAGAIASVVGQRAIGAGGDAFGAALRAVGTLGMLVFSAFLTAFFFYFFCTGYGALIEFWESLLPERRRGRAVELIKQMDRVVSSFVRGRLTICLILAVFITIAYWLIGVPAAFVLGPVIGLLFLMPFVHVLGVPAAWILMTLDSSGPAWQGTWWWILFAPIGVYMTCQLLDDWVLTPQIQGKNTGLDTPSILFASIAGGALAGVYGLLLGIPVAACVAILLREVFWPRFRQWAEGRARDPLPIG